MNWEIPENRTRQLFFHFRGRTIALKFKHPHTIGGKSGMVIVEMIGINEGETLVTIRDLEEAEQFYNEAPKIVQDRLAAAGGTRFPS